MSNCELLVKIRMSNNDLNRFKAFIETYTGELTFIDSRNSKLNMLLNDVDNNYTNTGYKVEFISFSRIDGFPLMGFLNAPIGKTIEEIIQRCELMDSGIKDFGEMEFQLVTVI